MKKLSVGQKKQESPSSRTSSRDSGKTPTKNSKKPTNLPVNKTSSSSTSIPSSRTQAPRFTNGTFVKAESSNPPHGQNTPFMDMIVSRVRHNVLTKNKSSAGATKSTWPISKGRRTVK